MAEVRNGKGGREGGREEGGRKEGRENDNPLFKTPPTELDAHSCTHYLQCTYKCTCTNNTTRYKIMNTLYHSKKESHTRVY